MQGFFAVCAVLQSAIQDRAFLGPVCRIANVYTGVVNGAAHSPLSKKSSPRDECSGLSTAASGLYICCSMDWIYVEKYRLLAPLVL